MSKHDRQTADTPTARPVVGWDEMGALSGGDEIRVTWETRDGDAKAHEATIAATEDRGDRLLALLAPEEWGRPTRRVAMHRDGTFTLERLIAGSAFADTWKPEGRGPVTVHRIDG